MGYRPVQQRTGREWKGGIHQQPKVPDQMVFEKSILQTESVSQGEWNVCGQTGTTQARKSARITVLERNQHKQRIFLVCDFPVDPQ